MTHIRTIESTEFAKCPYCEKDLDTIERFVVGKWVRHLIYRCPYCKKLLSIGSNLA